MPARHAAQADEVFRADLATEMTFRASAKDPSETRQRRLLRADTQQSRQRGWVLLPDFPSCRSKVCTTMSCSPRGRRQRGPEQCRWWTAGKVRSDCNLNSVRNYVRAPTRRRQPSWPGPPPPATVDSPWTPWPLASSRDLYSWAVHASPAIVVKRTTRCCYSECIVVRSRVPCVPCFSR